MIDFWPRNPHMEVVGGPKVHLLVFGDPPPLSYTARFLSRLEVHLEPNVPLTWVPPTGWRLLPGTDLVREIGVVGAVLIDSGVLLTLAHPAVPGGRYEVVVAPGVVRRDGWLTEASNPECYCPGEPLSPVCMGILEGLTAALGEELSYLAGELVLRVARRVEEGSDICETTCALEEVEDGEFHMGGGVAVGRVVSEKELYAVRDTPGDMESGAPVIGRRRSVLATAQASVHLATCPSGELLRLVQDGWMDPVMEWWMTPEEVRASCLARNRAPPGTVGGVHAVLGAMFGRLAVGARGVVREVEDGYEVEVGGDWRWATLAMADVEVGGRTRRYLVLVGSEGRMLLSRQSGPGYEGGELVDGAAVGVRVEGYRLDWLPKGPDGLLQPFCLVTRFLARGCALEARGEQLVVNTDGCLYARGSEGDRALGLPCGELRGVLPAGLTLRYQG